MIEPSASEVDAANGQRAVFEKNLPAPPVPDWFTPAEGTSAEQLEQLRSAGWDPEKSASLGEETRARNRAQAKAAEAEFREQFIETAMGQGFTEESAHSQLEEALAIREVRREAIDGRIVSNAHDVQPAAPGTGVEKSGLAAELDATRAEVAELRALVADLVAERGGEPS